MTLRRPLWLLCLVLFALGLCRVAFAADPDAAPRVQVRAHLELAGPVVAGTQVRLVVECLTTTWFTEAPDWPLFNVPNALVTLPDEDAVNLHEEIDGVSWFGVSRSYRIAPQTAGSFAVPSFAITVHPGGTDHPATLTTPALSFTASVPAGAEGMKVFFPSTRLEAQQKIDGAGEGLRVGDMVTRTVTQRAAGTESLLIPPVEFGDVDGLRRYTRPASTKNDIDDRAGLVAGERTDTVAYLVNRSGRFELPPLTIEWWNTVAHRKERIVLPAVRMKAAPANEKPLFGIPVDALSKGAPHRIVFIGARQLATAGAAFVGVFILVVVWPRLVRGLKKWRRDFAAARVCYANSAAPAWQALKNAVRKDSLHEVIPALYRWLDRSPAFDVPARLDDLAASGEPSLAQLERTIAQHYAGGTPGAMRWREVLRSLVKLTRRRQRRRHAKPDLPPLNRY